jgi:soluble lytic murein transglycosylase
MDGPGFLDADEERGYVPAIKMLETTTRTVPFPGSASPTDLPSLGAFRYFAAEKMKVQATGCARVYLANLVKTGKKDCTGTLYSEVREGNLEGLCLEMTVDNSSLFAGREDYMEYLYPFAFGSEIDRYSKEMKLPPELVLAVIREESRFDDAVESHAGAWGLMQIMPSTGGWIGGKVGRKDVTLSDLRDPAFNIEGGCWYLRFLLDRSDESIVAALASYNAGHGRMRSWKKRSHPDRDPFAAIELIGPSETRQYVRRVLDSMAAYSLQTSRGHR